jgi:VanZ family protein
LPASKSFLSSPIFVLRLIGWICLATIAVLSLVPGSVRPHVVDTGQVEHFVAYAGTAIFLAAGYSKKKQLFWILILLPVYAACMETLQIFVPGRTAQSIDAVVGAVGAWSGIGLVLLLRSWTAGARASH